MSKFLAFALPVGSAEEAKELIARYTNEYHDARHVGWAYMIGADRKTFLSSDNGEPSGTAGRPILGQINSAGITNVVVVVVRYFGTSGLIAAYREAASLAIAEAPKAECKEMTQLKITFPYLAMNDVMKIVKANQALTIVEQTFDNSCSLTLSLPLDMLEEISGRLGGVDGTSIV